MQDQTLERARALVDALADSASREDAFRDLEALDREAVPAIREGLRHGHWQVRRWCAIWLDRNAAAEALPDLIPLLEDPKSKVRLFAVHSLSCEHCKEDGIENPIDVFPLLRERVLHDESVRVRRMALAMLAYQYLDDPRVTALCRRILDDEQDAKLRLHANLGLLKRSQAP